MRRQQPPTPQEIKRQEQDSKEVMDVWDAAGQRLAATPQPSAPPEAAAPAESPPSAAERGGREGDAPSPEHARPAKFAKKSEGDAAVAAPGPSWLGVYLGFNPRPCAPKIM